MSFAVSLTDCVLNGADYYKTFEANKKLYQEVYALVSQQEINYCQWLSSQKVYLIF